jgi:hypothetical protein
MSTNSSSSSGDDDDVRYTGALHGRKSASAANRTAQTPIAAPSPAGTLGKASSSKKSGRKASAGQPGYVDVYGAEVKTPWQQACHILHPCRRAGSDRCLRSAAELTLLWYPQARPEVAIKATGDISLQDVQALVLWVLTDSVPNPKWVWVEVSSRLAVGRSSLCAAALRARFRVTAAGTQQTASGGLVTAANTCIPVLLCLHPHRLPQGWSRTA